MSSKIFVDGFVMCEPVHQVKWIVGKFFEVEYCSYYFFDYHAEVAFLEVAFDILIQRLIYLNRLIALVIAEFLFVKAVIEYVVAGVLIGGVGVRFLGYC
jgi:hypothetical protein